MSNASSNNGKKIASQGEEQPEGSESYECKYCQKKFSNKQALGGHQNAHKIERSIKKNGRDVQNNQFEYFAGHSSYPMISSGSPYPPGSFYRSQELVNRSLVINPYQSHYAPYPRPRFIVPAQPGWNVHGQVPQFAPPTPNMHHGSLNARFPVGGGGSNVRANLENAPFVGGSRVLLNENIGSQVNNEANPSENQQPEEENLDLSLKL